MNAAGGRLMSTETPSRSRARINYGERLLDGVLMAAHSGVRNLCPAAKDNPFEKSPTENLGFKRLVITVARKGLNRVVRTAYSRWGYGLMICLIVILLIGCSGAPVEPIGVDPVIDSLEAELKQTREALYRARCINKCYREMFPDSAVCQCGV